MKVRLYVLLCYYVGRKILRLHNNTIKHTILRPGIKIVQSGYPAYQRITFTIPVSPFFIKI